MNTAHNAPARLTEADLLARGYKHIVPDTLRFETRGRYEGKQTVVIKTFGPDGKYDGKTRRIATSDLHQCAWTIAGKEEIAPKTRKLIISKLVTA